MKIADSRNFEVAKNIAVAEVTVEPGAMRELHWHPTEDEWSYFLEGQGRMTLFASSSNAITFNYQAGDVAYIPATYGMAAPDGHMHTAELSHRALRGEYRQQQLEILGDLEHQ